MELFRATQNLPKLQSEWNLGLQNTIYCWKELYFSDKTILTMKESQN